MIPDALKNWRYTHGYSQSQLAKALGITAKTVYRWERGERKIPPFLYLALRSLRKKEGEVRAGRPAKATSSKKRS